MLDRLKELHKELDGNRPDGLRELHGTPGCGLAQEWAQRAARPGRSRRRDVLEPILKVVGARKLRELSAADVRQALSRWPPSTQARL